MCFKKKTTQGVKIDRRKIPGLPTDDEHSKVIDFIIEICSKSFDRQQVEESIKKITIEWWSDIAPSPSTGNLSTVVVYNDFIYNGLTIGNTCKVAWKGKIYRSAFVHEIMHVIGADILNDPNADHSNQQLLSIEREINSKLSSENL